MAQWWIALEITLVGLLLAGIVVILARYRKDIRAAHERLTNLNSRVIETAIGLIEYADVGKGYPVLIVHGAMGGFDQGLWLAESFGVTDHRVISISRFGYLRSPVPRGASLDSQADVFASLLDALHIQKVVAIGVSAGSTAAIRFTARHPQRVNSLLLVCPDAPGKVPIEIPPRFIFDTVLRSDFFYWVLVTFFGGWMRNALGMIPRGIPLTPALAAQIDQVQKGNLPVSQRMDGMIFESFTTLPDYLASVTPESPYPLACIQTPVFIVHALDDPITIPVNILEMAEQFNNARIYSVPNGGHFFFGHLEEVRSEIARFILECIPKPGSLD